MQRDYRPKCRFFAQSRCSKGSSCKFSHEGFQEIYLLRHAQSIFNSYSDKLQGVGFLSQQAKDAFQLKHQLIDCGLTQKGMEQAQNAQIPMGCYTMKKKKKEDDTIIYKIIDIVFVSPLNRALQTAQILLRKNGIKARQIIVLPQLSQVLSKVCDFSLSTEDKKKRYEKYNFDELDQAQKISNEKGAFWQDELLDRQHHKYIVHQQKHGARYMKILEGVFPTPLENSQQCFKRTMIALKKIQDIARKQSAQKILVVSHNRILKYICGRQNSGRAPSFLNCEFKKIMLQIDDY